MTLKKKANASAIGTRIKPYICRKYARGINRINKYMPINLLRIFILMASQVNAIKCAIKVAKQIPYKPKCGIRIMSRTTLTIAAKMIGVNAFSGCR